MARTLANFHDDVQQAMGNRGLVDATMTRFINDAYLDVAGGIDHEELYSIDTSITTVVGTEAYALPAANWLVEATMDVTNNLGLEYISQREFARRRHAGVSARGAPTHWTRITESLYLSPVPDAIVSIELIYRGAPTLLSGDADLMVLAEVWEPAILYLAVSNGFMSYNELSKASIWLQRAISYLQTKDAKTETLVNALMMNLALLKAEVA